MSQARLPGEHVGYVLLFASVAFFLLASHAVLFSAFLPDSGLEVRPLL